MSSFLDKLTKPFQKILFTMKAGYYTPATGYEEHPETIKLPQRPMLGAIVGMGGLVFDILLGAFQTVAFATTLVLGGVCAVAAGGIFLKNYLTCRQAAHQEISETNTAEQKVTGTREDLYTLHRAQKKIISLSYDFDKAASPHVVAREIDRIIEKSQDAMSRVTVEGHKKPGGYEFKTPKIVFQTVHSACAELDAACKVQEERAVSADLIKYATRHRRFLMHRSHG